MNDEMTDTPSATRRLTDTALLIVAIVAVVTWMWRRLRHPADVDAGNPAGIGADSSAPADSTSV